MRDNPVDMAAGFQNRLGRPATGGGRLALAVFFSVFLAVGLLFEGLMVRDFAHAARSRSWPETPCEIVSSRVEQSGHYYTFEVEYRYRAGGRERTSRQDGLKKNTSSDYSEVQRRMLRYPAGAQAICYVNPESPNEAVLERASLWSGFGLLFPLIFVAIGGGGIFFCVRGFIRDRRGRNEPEALASQPLSARAGNIQGRKILIAFFGVFFLTGAAVFFFTFVRPVLRIIDARGWERTSCVVISSEVTRHSGSKGGSTYSVNILYSYEVKGREYRANRYNFMGGSSSGYDGKAAIVNRHPPGAKTFCYVNPRDPTDAVLEPGVTADLWFGLIPLVFVVVGVGGLYFTLRSKKQDGASLSPQVEERMRRFFPGAANSGRPLVRDEAEASPSRVLKPQFSPGAKLLGIICVAAFWNGIGSVFVWQVIQSWRKHNPEWFLTVFMIPFVAIGLVMIGYVFYMFLSLFNPRPRLTVTPGDATLGGPLDVRWELSGRTDRISRLSVRLEGREEATYRRGTSTSTDKSVFAKIELFNTTDRAAIRSGQARVVVPPDLMHSWASGHNKIVWSLQIHGDIQWWPDVKEEFPFTVLPQRTASTKMP